METNSPIQKRLIDITGVAERLGVRPKTIYAWVHMRQIPYVKMGRLVKFDVADIDTWVQSRKVKTIEV